MANVKLGAKARAVVRRLQGKRVAVLMGGWSKERPVSLRTGAGILNALRVSGVNAFGIDVKPDVLRKLQSTKIDLAVLGLHGPFGEDGRLQGALDILGIPYTGCGVLASALAMDKVASKLLFENARVPTPGWTTVDAAVYRSNASAAMEPSLALLKKGPIFVKPFDQGSAFGANRADGRASLKKALEACFRMSTTALVERFIDGKELTVGILGDEALPVVEIVPEHAFYDYHSKYAKGGSRHLCPAPISADATRRAQAAALGAYRALGCQAYGRVDVLMDKKGGMWVLEVNTIPGMTATSLLPDAARAAGLSYEELVLTIIDLSLAARPAGARR